MVEAGNVTRPPEFGGAQETKSQDTAARNPSGSYDWSLIFDLERELRYASSSKDVDVPADIAGTATLALQAAKDQMFATHGLTPDAQLNLLKCIDAISPKIYPVTTASLEIADIMGMGNTRLDDRQRDIRNRVYTLRTIWTWAAVIALFAVFVMTALSAAKSSSATATPGFLGLSIDFLRAFAIFVDPIILGFLGACAYILRTILQGMANQTFVLRDGTTYTLRAILGMILGFIIPNLIGDPKTFGFLLDVAVPFLAGYAVEPMFAALDNVVLTLRDAVSRSATPAKATK